MKHWKELRAEEFYERRDERTSTLVEGSLLRKARLTLSIGEQEAETFSGQLCYLLLVNMNSRWCREIDIIAPPVALHPALGGLGKSDLRSASLGIAFRADPFGRFTPGTKTTYVPESMPVEVHVGVSGPDQSYPVMGRGWLATAGISVKTGLPPGEDENPLGATLAACIGTCYAMRKTLGLTPVYSDARLSLWNLESGPEAEIGPRLERATLGRVLLVGAGAIGAGIVYLLPLIRPHIERMALVDGDLVDYPNLNRVPIFFADDINATKVEVSRQYLAGWSIESQAIPKWFNDSGLSLQDYDLIIPAANEKGVREAIMSNIPPLMISGSTGSQWDAYRQRHIPLVDDCLSCRFPPRKEAPRLTCATGALSVPKEGAASETGALPFLSVTGAVMAVAEIAKLAYGNYPLQGNYSTLWFSGEELRFTNANKVKRAECSYCIHPDIFETLSQNGRFATLSRG